jgi:manganese/zinc/iron transport system substrate-binding protein
MIHVNGTAATTLPHTISTLSLQKYPSYFRISTVHAFATALAILFLALPCFADSTKPTSAKVSIVTTTGIIGDTVSSIGGSHVEVTSIMGEGVDPHLYKASPGDMKKLLGSDLVLYNGLHLEGKMSEALEKLSSRRPVVAVTRSVPKELLRAPPDHPDASDPHVWFSPKIWRYVIDEIAHTLSAHLPSAASDFASNAARVKGEYNELDSWIRGQIATIPVDKRILITAHDAFSYFGAEYGINVLSIQGMSTDSEASLQEINQLVETIVSKNIPAVFVESSVPQKTITALTQGASARGHKVSIGGELFSDALGATGSDVGTLPGIIRHNTTVIVKALSRN